MSPVLAVLLGIVLIEAICFYGRFALRKTGAGGVRAVIVWRGRKIGLHHGPIGLVLVVVYGISFLPHDVLFWGLLISGLVLIISDAIHHCLLKLMFGEWDPAEPNPRRHSP